MIATAHVLQNYATVPESGCWLWLGGWDNDGYGKINKNGKTVAYAHRFFYQIHKGEIPDGKLVLHKCDSPACCNPDHLFLGTHADNALDKCRKGRLRNGRRKDKIPPETVNAIVSSSGTVRGTARLHGVSLPTVRRLRSNG